jgi:hypothetical protein
MAKVIVERPRLGGGVRTPKGILRRWQRVPLGDRPVKQGMRRPWSNNRKSLNENLAPLRRFLERRVGRRWDDVFSEICEHLRVDSAVQKHVRDHLDDFVAVHVERIDGRIVPRGARRFESGFGGWRRFYVDPDSGVLKGAWAGEFSRPRRPATRPAYVDLGAGRQLRCLEGLWYEVVLAPVYPFMVRHVHWDVCERKSLSELYDWDLREKYGGLYYAVRKRQLNRKEIRRHKLRELHHQDPSRQAVG